MSHEQLCDLIRNRAGEMNAAQQIYCQTLVPPWILAIVVMMAVAVIIAAVVLAFVRAYQWCQEPQP